MFRPKVMAGQIRKIAAVLTLTAFFVNTAVLPVYSSGDNLRPAAAKQSRRLSDLGRSIKDGGAGQQVRDAMKKLHDERFNERLESADPDFARWGYEEDNKISRLGWTVRNIKAILDMLQRDNLKIPAETLRLKTLVEQNGFKYVIFCGMGGSGLSVELAKQTFDPQSKGIRFYSLRTTDPAAIKAILDEIALSEGNNLKAGLDKTMAVFMSKTATTQETTEHEKYFKQLFGIQGIQKPESHLFYVTDPGSPWDGYVKNGQGVYIQMNDINPGKEFNLKDVGGRFTSPSTNIFMLPWSLTSGAVDIRPILSSAVAMNSGLMEDYFLKMGAEVYVRANEYRQDKLTMIVPPELKALPMWTEQLYEESLGKNKKGVTIFYGEDFGKGPKDWKKSLKPAAENDRIFLRINIGKKGTDQAFWNYLKKNRYPVIEIDINDINDIGGVMVGLQRMVAVIGYLWDIRFVNQPGVESYKKESKAIDRKMKDADQTKQDVLDAWQSMSVRYGGSFTLYYAPLVLAGIVTSQELESRVNDLGANLRDAPAVYAAILQLMEEKAKQNELEFGAAEISSYGKLSPAMKGILEGVRKDIFTVGFRMPSKLGEGPDKNHSYQQNIQDGRNMFFSTYFTSLNNPQPGLKFDDNLLFAQTIGTVTAMFTASEPRKVALFVADEMNPKTEIAYRDYFDKVKEYLGISADGGAEEITHSTVTAAEGAAETGLADKALAIDRSIYQMQELNFGNMIGSVSEIENSRGAVIIGARAIFDNAGSVSALQKAKEAAGVVNFAVWARDEKARKALEALGVDKYATIYVGLQKTLDALKEAKIPGERIVLITSHQDRDNLMSEFKIQELEFFYFAGIKHVPIDTRISDEQRSINAMPLVMSKALAMIFNDESAVKAQMKNMAGAYLKEGLITESEMADIMQLASQIAYEIPMVPVSEEIAAMQTAYEDILNKI
ncbi:MAG TPA: hypothetical protein PLP56_02775 [Candidatus Omnitrophota bacterium]|nr:hypothetical protein [Candidatus Omnitrophota bacterium]